MHFGTSDCADCADGDGCRANRDADDGLRNGEYFFVDVRIYVDRDLQ